ncbi:MAG TPA: fimbria/pilus outer membrane usher protein [Allosphingosinicella sp.]|jgi:outer membrane usher protein|nr:fimbria/pilus outer membrane usher protein [Allosphingosinicella sp.]
MSRRAASLAAAGFGLAWLLTCLPEAALAAPAASPRPLLLEMTVNASEIEEPQLFLSGPDGALYASATALHHARLRLTGVETLNYQGETFYRIDHLASLHASVSEERQSVTIEADPALFESQSAQIGAAALPRMTRPATGLFVNYDVVGEHSNGQSSASGEFEINGFAAGGVATSNFVVHGGAGGTSAVRLETSFTVDRPDHMSSLRIGDTISRGGVGAASFRFAGLQYARNFDTQPGFITMPLPSLGGSAALPSTLDVYVNNALQGTKAVQPGPFQLAEIPVQAGGGDIRLVMRDVLGREVIVDQPYYASRDMLRNGLNDFSYEVGFVRKDFSVSSNSYGPLMASVTQRYGLTDGMTLDMHAAATARLQNFGAGTEVLLGRFGIFSGEMAAMLARGRVSTQVSAGLEHHSNVLSLGAHGQITGRSYQSAGVATLQPSPRTSVDGFADLRLANRVSIGLNTIVRTRYAAPSERIAGAYAHLGFGSAGGLQFYAQYAAAEHRSLTIGFSLSLLLQHHRSATLSVDTEQGRPTAYASIQSDPPVGIGSGWRLNAALGSTNAVGGAYTLHTGSSAFTVEAAQTDRQTGIRLSATGSIELVDGQVFASRQLGNSFASVSVGPYSGVRIYADNQLVARTDRSGHAIVPGLRPYESNRIRVEDADLPIEAQMLTSESAVRPYAKTGVAVSFTPVATNGLVLWVRTPDGAALAAGASVAIDGRSDGTIVAPGGMIYVPTAAGDVQLTVRWPGHLCRVTAALPARAGPQPVLRGLVCRPPAILAAAQ